MKKNTNIHISIVSPVYRAATLVDALVERITKSVSQITPDFEIILVEDGGPDNSWEKMVENAKKNPHVKGFKLSRNFGQQYAINAGLDQAKGEWIIIMDCDLQDRPEEIYKLYNKAQEGYDIVMASRINRKDDFIKKSLSRFFHTTMSYLTGTTSDNTVAHFMILNRKVVQALQQTKDYHRYYPMLVKWIGFKNTKLEIEHAEREEGKSSYNFKRRLDLALDTILSFSDKPLRLAVKTGALISILSVFIAIWQIILYFQGKIPVTGWISLFIAISFFSGLIISVLGIVGLYVGKTFESVKNRPTYIIAEKTH